MVDEPQTLDQCIAACRRMIADGAARADILAYLIQPGTYAHKERPNCIEALKVLREAYGVGLQGALGILAESPDWAPYYRHILS